MEKAIKAKYPNEILTEDVTMTSARSSYDDMNGLTLIPNASIQHQLEKICSKKTEKYDPEHGGLETVEPITTNITMASVIELPDEHNEFYKGIPNGGYGWVVAVAGFLINFVMFGTVSIWGVFSNAFANTILKDKATTLELMGVGATLSVCLNAFTPLSPVLAQLGPRITMVIGSTLMSLGMILSGFSTEVWHLYLSQGVLFGIGASIIYMSIVAVIPQWFTTRRGTAMGISSAGSGFGGLALSPMVSSLVQKYGLPWTYRIVGLMGFGICMIASCLIRTRLPPGHQNQPMKSPIRISLLKNTDFVIMLAGLVISLTGYLIPLFYMPKYCAAQGINSIQASNMVGVACAMNAIGRLILGYFADRIGHLNMYAMSSTFAGLMCMLLWPFAKTYESMMAFAVLFGFTCGIYYTLAAPITAKVVGPDNISAGLAILFVASAISGTGSPIASAIEEASKGHGYLGVQMFSGAVYIFGSLICVALKYKMTGSLFSIM